MTASERGESATDLYVAMCLIKHSRMIRSWRVNQKEVYSWNSGEDEAR